jgi:hypothetical protein
MGEIHEPSPVKLFTGVITSVPSIMPRVEQLLVPVFGPVDLRTELFVFDQTRYYDEEMGSPLYRCFISFETLIEPSVIADAKLRTNGMEAVLAADFPGVKRPINLDPGYLEQSKIVLASTKNFYHRILLSHGIYGEVTLHFEKGGWKSFPWTFPDYRTDRYHPFFTSLRNVYREQLRINRTTVASVSNRPEKDGNQR